MCDLMSVPVLVVSVGEFQICVAEHRVNGIGRACHLTRQRKNDEDTARSEYQDMTARVEKLYVEISEAAAFVTPELLAIPDERIVSIDILYRPLVLRRNVAPIRYSFCHLIYSYVKQNFHV